MTPGKTPPRLATLVVLTATTLMSLNMFLPALPILAIDLGTDYATASWAISGYLAATGLVQLVAGPISDNVGRRPVVLTALAVFALASIGCALSQTITQFLLFRFGQSVAVAGYAMSLAIVLDTTETDAATSKLGTISASVAIVPMLSPFLGGLLTEFLGWRSCFWLYALCGLGLLAITYVDLGETRKPGNASPAEDRSRLLRNPRFWGFAACMGFSVGAFYIFLAGAPLVATQVFGINSAILGGILGSITAGFLVGSIASARLGQRLGPMPLILTGRTVALIGLTTGMVLFLFGATSPYLYFAATWCVGIGNGLTTPGANASALSVEPKAAGAAAGICGATVVFCGAGLTAIAGSTVGGDRPELILLALMLLSSIVGFCALLLTRQPRQF